MPKIWARKMLSWNGRESSMAYMSEENRLMMRPIGVVSKNETGAWTQKTSFNYSFFNGLQWPLHQVKQNQKLIKEHSIVFFCFNNDKTPKCSMHMKIFAQFLHFQANMLLHFCSVPLSPINLQENTKHSTTFNSQNSIHLPQNNTPKLLQSLK